MNKIDYNQPGGFGLSTQILDAAQEAYKTFNAYGSMAGEIAIITGCEVGGSGFVNDGFVSIYGELLPFKGGQQSANVAIVEIADARGFEDGSIKPVIYTRYATFGEGTPSYPWSSFRRPLTLFKIEDELVKLRKSVPIGLVAVWGKFTEDIPEGWEPWDIAAGCVIAGRKVGDVNFGAAQGSKIGAAQITLDINQIPAHNHDSEINSSGDDVDSDGFGSAVVTSNREITGINRQNVIRIKNRGGGQPHSNIQPSLIADHIIFVGFD
ncbi:hypothetical protein [Epilithonimonas arachidiradicis]|uniref:Uncharacterized protein n=1 Tax=Epilithonimonas arachidiradicis TaxID=1617282 RepID=A0A420DDY7_9FLAO|nr:hypothetical protein [Epilithonimonas arachidiradicis]RKE89996.1 hypothetical protein BXY58_0581 [Epilithonimonas arachidiradicis]GGG46924.1 hypothetical protein GCM10007332_05560 [Epilithonimonas arachidiradicis]